MAAGKLTFVPAAASVHLGSIPTFAAVQHLHDPRHLWPDVARIIDECEPEWVFCENVEGHLDRGFEEVAGDLQAMGFSLKAGLFSAAEVGAAHIRKRLFIMAHANDKPLLQSDRYSDQCRGLSISGGRVANGKPSGNRQGSPCLDSHVAFPEGGRRNGAEDFQLPVFAPAPCDLDAWDTYLDRRLDLQPELLGLAHGLAHRVERSRAAGNGVVPLAAAYAYRTLKAAFTTI